MKKKVKKKFSKVKKKRILKNSLLDLNILKVYDDREELIQMWREAGLECVDCSSQEV